MLLKVSSLVLLLPVVAVSFDATVDASASLAVHAVDVSRAFAEHEYSCDADGAAVSGKNEIYNYSTTETILIVENQEECEDKCSAIPSCTGFDFRFQNSVDGRTNYTNCLLTDVDAAGSDDNSGSRVDYRFCAKVDPRFVGGYERLCDVGEAIPNDSEGTPTTTNGVADGDFFDQAYTVVECAAKCREHDECNAFIHNSQNGDGGNNRQCHLKKQLQPRGELLTKCTSRNRWAYYIESAEAAFKLDGYKFVGCYEDSAIYRRGEEKATANDAESCASTCAEAGHQYFALQYDNQCFCPHPEDERSLVHSTQVSFHAIGERGGHKCNCHKQMGTFVGDGDNSATRSLVRVTENANCVYMVDHDYLIDEAIQALNTSHEQTLENQHDVHNQTIQNLNNEHDQAIQALNTSHNQTIQALNTSHNQTIQNLSETHNANYMRLEEMCEEVGQLSGAHAISMQSMRDQYENTIALNDQEAANKLVLQAQDALRIKIAAVNDSRREQLVLCQAEKDTLAATHVSREGELNAIIEQQAATISQQADDITNKGIENTQLNQDLQSEQRAKADALSERDNQTSLKTQCLSREVALERSLEEETEAKRELSGAMDECRRREGVARSQAEEAKQEMENVTRGVQAIETKMADVTAEMKAQVDEATQQVVSEMQVSLNAQADSITQMDEAQTDLTTAIATASNNVNSLRDSLASPGLQSIDSVVDEQVAMHGQTLGSEIDQVERLLENVNEGILDVTDTLQGAAVVA